MQVALVIPAYNEAATLPRLRARLTPVLDGLAPHTGELIIVDDHSTDATPEVIIEWAAADSRVRGLRLARTCGPDAARAAGLAQCTADCAVILAADLPDPPALVAQLVAQWQAGHDVVWGVRAAHAGEGGHTRLTTRMHGGLMRLMVGPQALSPETDVVLLSRPAIDALNAVPEWNSSLRALIQWRGFRQTQVPYVRAPQVGGRSGWTLRQHLKLALDSVLASSSAPMRLTWLAGVFWLTAAGVWTLAWLIGCVVGAVAAPVLALLVSVVLAGVGSLLVGLGLVGACVRRADDSARGRPRFVIERYLGAAPVPPAAPAPASAATVAAPDVSQTPPATADTPRRAATSTARVYT